LSSKYEPLKEFLGSVPAGEEVGVDLRVVDRMVGGLPPNAR
jgi:hypothetical protein